MILSHRTAAAAGLICLALLTAGCASSAATTPAADSATGSSAPASSAPASSAPASSAPASPAAAASKVQIKTAKTSIGTILVNAQGFTLYSFAKDTSTSSACSGACAAAWPPVIGTPVAASGVTLSGKLGTIKRSDGTLQATYDGHPLYTFAGDSAPGQVKGNGLNGLWHAITPSGSMPVPPPPPPAAPAATAPAATAPAPPAPAASPSAGGGGYGY
jgi:predicted lipoprotein with Yx(FWY)xxD motif